MKRAKQEACSRVSEIKNKNDDMMWDETEVWESWKEHIRNLYKW